MAWSILNREPIRSGLVPAIARIWRGEVQLVAGVEAAIRRANKLKRDLLAAVVQREPGASTSMRLAPSWARVAPLMRCIPAYATWIVSVWRWGG